MRVEMSAPAAAPEAPKSPARQTAEAFEAMTLAELLKPLFESAPEGFGGGMGEEMFKPMLVDQYAKSLASQGGVGLASLIEAQLLQEG